MRDLISRKQAVKRMIEEIEVTKKDFIHINEIKRLLQDVDAIEAVPVVHAKWVDDTGCLDSVRQYKCSHCGQKPIVNMSYITMLTDFCPDCGAKMDGGKE